jgi:hypothetical protein
MENSIYGLIKVDFIIFPQEKIKTKATLLKARRSYKIVQWLWRKRELKNGQKDIATAYVSTSYFLKKI